MDRAKEELKCCKKDKSQVETNLTVLQSQQADLNRELQEAVATKQELNLQLAEERQKKEQTSSDQDKLASKLDLIKGELADLKEGEERRWQERKAAFLQSPEHCDLLGIKTNKILRYGFDGAGKHFVQSRLIPKRADLSFLDPHKVWDDLPESEKWAQNISGVIIFECY